MRLTCPPSHDTDTLPPAFAVVRFLADLSAPIAPAVAPVPAPRSEPDYRGRWRAFLGLPDDC